MSDDCPECDTDDCTNDGIVPFVVADGPVRHYCDECMDHTLSPCGGDDDATKTRVAECPMSWCAETAVVEDPDDPYAAAREIETHVNEDHSEKDLETLDRYSTGGEQP